MAEPLPILAAKPLPPFEWKAMEKAMAAPLEPEPPKEDLSKKVTTKNVPKKVAP